MDLPLRSATVRMSESLVDHDGFGFGRGRLGRNVDELRIRGLREDRRAVTHHAERDVTRVDGQRHLRTSRKLAPFHVHALGREHGVERSQGLTTVSTRTCDSQAALAGADCWQGGLGPSFALGDGRPNETLKVAVLQQPRAHDVAADVQQPRCF